jgi:anti-sigma regulatory factor (Ser/Thr protein kinase)
MKDISYHIMDIARNSLHAGANTIRIEISHDAGIYKLRITDDGTGMPVEVLEKVTDPFFTSSVTKKVGLGLPLLKQNAEMTGGSFEIFSEENSGTTVTVVFNSNHIDMIPEGNLALTFKMLIASNPEIDFIYIHEKDGKKFFMDTSEIRKELDGISLNTKEVLNYIYDYVSENQKALDQETVIKKDFKLI